MILEVLAWGFFSAFGWWGAQHYIIEPYFPKNEVKQEKDLTKDSK